jgi:hypothetical protein
VRQPLGLADHGALAGPRRAQPLPKRDHQDARQDEGGKAGRVPRAVESLRRAGGGEQEIAHQPARGAGQSGGAPPAEPGPGPHRHDEREERQLIAYPWNQQPPHRHGGQGGCDGQHEGQRLRGRSGPHGSK